MVTREGPSAHPSGRNMFGTIKNPLSRTQQSCEHQKVEIVEDTFFCFQRIDRRHILTPYATIHPTAEQLAI